MAEIDYYAVLADLEEQVVALDEERESLEQREAALWSTLESLRDFIRLNDIKSMSAGTPNEALAPSKYPFRDLGIVQAAILYLRAGGRPQKNKELVDALLAGGFPSKAKDPYVTIRSVLMREMKENGTFTYDQTKSWGLPEWEQQNPADEEIPMEAKP